MKTRLGHNTFLSLNLNVWTFALWGHEAATSAGQTVADDALTHLRSIWK